MALELQAQGEDQELVEWWQEFAASMRVGYVSMRNVEFEHDDVITILHGVATRSREES